MVKRAFLLLLILLFFVPITSAQFMINYTCENVGANNNQGISYTPIKAIDDNLATTAQGYDPYRFYCDFGSSKYIEGINITLSSGFTAYGFDIFETLGSNDNSTFYILDQVNGVPTWSVGINKTFDFYNFTSNRSSYRYIQIHSKVSKAANPDMSQIYFYNKGGGTAEADTTPPASITNLANTTTCENVTFTWTNPSNSDYSHLYNLWDNAVQGNLTNSTTTKAFTPATVGSHTFSTKTVDLSYNMNATWVNQSVVITACPTPTPTPTPSTTTTSAPTTCTAPTSPPWCAHQDIFLYSAYDDIAGLRRMTNVPEINGTKTITSASITSSSGEVTLGTWLTPTFSSTDSLTLAPGLWVFRSHARASSDAGTTTLKYRVFNRTATGTITWLFYGNAFSKDIGSGTIPSLYETSYARRNYTQLFPGDRLGIQINVST